MGDLGAAGWAQPLPMLIAAGLLLVAGCLLLHAVARRRRQRAASRETRLHEELLASRGEVSALAAQVAELAGQVAQSRAGARTRSADREYVITTLAELAPEPESARAPGSGRLPVGRAGDRLERRVAQALRARSDRAPWAGRATEVAVRSLALGHGLRRALAPDVLDRAAAEAQVARRRSRRLRRRELREARRLVRAVRSHRAQDAA